MCHVTSIPEDRLTGITIQRYRKSYVVVYGFKILCEISKVAFEISHKISNLYTVKKAFYKVLKV